MPANPAPPQVGDLLRDWRRRRHMSQLDLALEADTSARHLSFVETGRSQPSRELLLRLAGHLEVPLRERNPLLLAAGYAPIYRETSLTTPVMAPVREAIDKILTGHEPFPAIAVDRQWDVVSANRPAMAVLTRGVAPDLLRPPVNALRLSLHPDGLARRIVNFAEWSSHLLDRVRRQALVSGDRDLTALHDELRSYADSAGTVQPHRDDPALFVSLVLSTPDGQRLRFLSTLTTFGTALDITVAELAVESFFPADDSTAAYLTSVTSADP